MNRSERGPMPFDKHQEEFAALDALLDVAENVLVELLTVKRLRRPNIERWRWDQPVVGLSWLAHDRLERNINAMVLNGATGPGRMHVEANAWMDASIPFPSNRVRLWKHLDVGDAPFPLELGRFRELINLAYNHVVELQSRDLDERAFIAPLPSGHPWG